MSDQRFPAGARPHPELQRFPILIRACVRWGEMDAFGHVNNTVFFRYFEIARVAYFDAVGFREGGRIGPILASTSCRFRRPLEYPDTVHVGARTVDVQDDRFTHEYVLVSEQRNEVAALGEGLVVAYDYERATRTALPADVLARIEGLTALGAHASLATPPPPVQTR